MIKMKKQIGGICPIKKIWILALAVYLLASPQIMAQPSQLTLNLKTSADTVTPNTHFTLTGTSTPPIDGSIRLFVGQPDSMFFDTGMTLELKNGVWSKELWYNQTSDWTFKILYYGNEKYASAQSNIVKISVTNVSPTPNPKPGTTTPSPTPNTPGQNTAAGGIPGYTIETILIGVIIALFMISKSSRVPTIQR